MRSILSVAACCLTLACVPKARETIVARAVHTATAQDTAFVRANCAMPDSVLAGTKACIDRVQASKVRVF